jgi:hypothetical protein
MKTNYQDPGTSEMRSTQIAGIQESLGKIEDILDMQLQVEVGLPLTEVYISAEDRYRIYQAPAGKRNWAASPAPVIKKNDVVITEGFTVDYAGGAIIASPSAISTDVFTADVSYTKVAGNKLETYLAETMTYEGRKYQIYNPYKNGGALHPKGQIHLHTTDSDGVDTPAVAVTAYKNAGYAFVAKTDHNVIGDDPLVAGIIFIPGVEETSVRHVTAYDITEQTDLYGTQEIIDFHRNRSKLCSIAHPSWSGGVISDIEMASYYNYNFTEVFNSKANVYDEARWDAALSTGKKIYAIAVDDCHDVVGTDFNKGWVVVNANTLDKASILQSLREGNFYASTGNDLSISLDGKVLTVESSETSEITFYGNNGRTLLTVANTTSAQYTIKGDEMYVRAISKRLSDNKLAWSQPIFLETYGGDGREVGVSNTLLSDSSLYAEFGINANQSIPNAASTLLVLDKVITASPFLFELNESDGGKIKILKKGVYEIITTVTFASNVTGYRRLSNQAKQITISAAGGGQTIHCVEIAKFGANQLFDVYVTQTSGGDLDVIAGQNTTAVQIRRIG